MKRYCSLLMGVMCIFVYVIYMQNFSYALDFGHNITIYDNSSTNTNIWYGQQEDNEVEPGDEEGQKWDLEGFFLKGYTLSVIGGFDFKDGVYDASSGQNVTVGDIFLDITGDAQYGGDTKNSTGSSNGINNLDNLYGYEYAIRLNFENGKFRVFEIGDSDILRSVYYRDNDWSNPWRYPIKFNKKHNGVQEVYKGFLSYYKLADPNTLPTNLNGNSLQGDATNNLHYGFSLDLSFLPDGTEFISHLTIKCGNDNLMGRGILPAPEPATMLLFGTGLIGFAAITRKKIRANRD